MSRPVRLVPSLLLLCGLAYAEDAPAPAPVVQGERVEAVGAADAGGYAQEREASSATKGGGPLLETPQAISVVPRELMDDQGARKLDDVLRNVAGVMPGGYYASWDYYRIRGFDAAFSTHLDGLLMSEGKDAEIYNLEQVEVVKGPASALFGSGSPGGIVNLVSKKPLPRTFLDTRLAVGSESLIEPALDAGVVLTEDASVYARLVLLVRDSDTFVDHTNKDRVFAAPSLTWEMGRGATLTVLGTLRRDSEVMGPPLPASGTVAYNPNGEIPIDTYLGQTGGADHVEEDLSALGYQFRWKLTDALSVRQDLRAEQHHGDWEYVLYPGSLEADGRTLHRNAYDYLQTNNTVRVDTAIDAAVVTGAVSHRLSLGVELARSRGRAHGWYGADDPIDIFDPVYGGPRAAMFDLGATESSEYTRAIYAQEQATIAERLILLAGARFDRSSNQTDTSDGFSPRLGATFLVTREASVYASWGRSFEPQFGSYDASGDQVDPQRGTNLEAGVKVALIDGLLTASTAVFQLTRSNVATTDPDNPFAVVVSGEQRSRGFELEGAATPLPGLSVTGAFTFMSAEVTEDNVIPEGNRLVNVPMRSLTGWARYTLQDGTLRGLGAGLGASGYSDQAGDQQNSFDIPGYALVEAALYYDRGPLSAQLNVENLLNTRYFTGSYDALYVQPGAPIAVVGTLGYSF